MGSTLNIAYHQLGPRRSMSLARPYGVYVILYFILLIYIVHVVFFSVFWVQILFTPYSLLKCHCFRCNNPSSNPRTRNVKKKKKKNFCSLVSVIFYFFKKSLLFLILFFFLNFSFGSWSLLICHFSCNCDSKI